MPWYQATLICISRGSSLQSKPETFKARMKATDFEMAERMLKKRLLKEAGYRTIPAHGGYSFSCGRILNPKGFWVWLGGLLESIFMPHRAAVREAEHIQYLQKHARMVGGFPNREMKALMEMQEKQDNERWKPKG
jgi:hypothetical protein